MSNQKPKTKKRKPKTQNLKPKTQNPKPKPKTQNPKPKTQNPKPAYRHVTVQQRSHEHVHSLLVWLVRDDEADVAFVGELLGVWGLGFGVWGLGFGVWGLGFGVWDWGLGVKCLGLWSDLLECDERAHVELQLFLFNRDDFDA